VKTTIEATVEVEIEAPRATVRTFIWEPGAARLKALLKEGRDS